MRLGLGDIDNYINDFFMFPENTNQILLFPLTNSGLRIAGPDLAGSAVFPRPTAWTPEKSCQSAFKNQGRNGQNGQKGSSRKGMTGREEGSRGEITKEGMRDVSGETWGNTIASIVRTRISKKEEDVKMILVRRGEGCSEGVAVQFSKIISHKVRGRGDEPLVLRPF